MPSQCLARKFCLFAEEWDPDDFVHSYMLQEASLSMMITIKLLLLTATLAS